jgi:hypothetical protein
MPDRPSWAPAEIDLDRPSVARVYDYYLGGSHNFESDRAFAREVLAVMPQLPVLAQHNRDFLRRAVLHLCAAGIDQFVDLGSGIPTAGNVHEIAHGVDPRARVAYVDHDPVAVSHSRELLQGNDRAVVVAADLRSPGAVLADPVLRGHIDLSRPVAVLLVSVLHFVSDDEDPRGVVAAYMRATAPGSHLVISHARSDGRREAVAAQAVYNQARSPNPMRMRSRAEIGELFGELALVDPGLVPMPVWRPDDGDGAAPDVADDYPGLAGVARRD